ncbi:MAG: hypothetical protein K0R41_4000, partial [Geminicoccaceae bacterium]|nr:hypothetical protein [Geminicoccaceae bacterium]
MLPIQIEEAGSASLVSSRLRRAGSLVHRRPCEHSAGRTAPGRPYRLVGFGPLFIAQEKDLFAAEGVEVELIRIEEHTTTYAGLYSGQIDAVA